jgi:hypothetical protein
MVAAIALFLAGPAAPGAVISSVGQHLGLGSDVRETDVPKPLDLDGDDVLGTDGYVWWNTTLNNEGGESGANFNDDILMDLPAWIDSISSINADSAGGFDYENLDDPRETPDADVPDIEAGQATVDLSEFAFDGEEVDAYQIGLTSGVPERFRLSFITDTFENDDKNLPESFRVHGAGGSSGQITYDRATRLDIDVYYVDVVGAQPGDLLTVAVTNRSSNFNVITNSALGFDTPEPAAGALLAITLLAVTWRQRR